MGALVWGLPSARSGSVVPAPSGTARGPSLREVKWCPRQGSNL